MACEREAEDVLGEVQEIADDARVEHARVERVAVTEVDVAEDDLEDLQGPGAVGADRAEG